MLCRYTIHVLLDIGLFLLFATVNSAAVIMFKHTWDLFEYLLLILLCINLVEEFLGLPYFWSIFFLGIEFYVYMFFFPAL